MSAKIDQERKLGDGSCNARDDHSTTKVVHGDRQTPHVHVGGANNLCHNHLDTSNVPCFQRIDTANYAVVAKNNGMMTLTVGGSFGDTLVPTALSDVPNPGQLYPSSYGARIDHLFASVIANRSPPPTLGHDSHLVITPKQSERIDVSSDLVLLVAQQPAIPRAFKASLSPCKPLHCMLKNQRGVTNVYIRGFLPDMTDDRLQACGSRFGVIKSSKTIIDVDTGLRKRFGFVEYRNCEDAANCIRGFHYLAYEANFAKFLGRTSAALITDVFHESPDSKLKSLADDGNTNLYVRNLPQSMDEHDLSGLFAPHKVCSALILRDNYGYSHGVGFARYVVHASSITSINIETSFENRNVCEKVINAFSEHGYKKSVKKPRITVCFANTPSQKALKQRLQAARNFRSAEAERTIQAWRAIKFGTNAAVPCQNQHLPQSITLDTPGRITTPDTLCANATYVPVSQDCTVPLQEDEEGLVKETADMDLSGGPCSTACANNALVHSPTTSDEQ